MDPNQSFYDVLEIPRDATPDQIRKAYKKQALQTHPDRLPAGFTPAQKQHAEDRFRKVSNAYEVLKDPENRRLYDTHGVWPPPTQPQDQQYSPQPRRSGHRPSRYEPFPDPFAGFFTEPFDLFDKMFSDYRRPSYHPVNHSSSNWHRDPFEAMYRIQDMMADLERDMFTSFASPFTRSHSIGFESPAFGDRGQIRWAQESTMLNTVNGVTTRVHKRRDWGGNEHVTRTYSDGRERREVYTINGVEQQRSPRGYLPPPGPPPPPQDPRNMPPPPPQMNNPRGYISPAPSYHSSRSSAHSKYGHRAPNGYRRGHSEEPFIPADPGPVIPDMNAPRADRARRWWHGGNGR